MRNLKITMVTSVLLLASVLLFSCATKTYVPYHKASGEALAAMQLPSTMQPLNVPDTNALLKEYKPISLAMFGDGISHARFGTENGTLNYPVYSESQIVGIAENMLTWQTEDGGWAKNTDYCRILKESEWADPRFQGSFRGTKSTLDNGNIYTQIQYLSLVYQQVPDPRYVESMLKAFDWIVKNQNPISGGFRGADVDAVTFNDGVMSGVLALCEAIVHDQSRYGFFTPEMRVKAQEVYDKTLNCILKCQIKVKLADGSTLLTAWGQQHDHTTLLPVWARNYEPPSITASESCGVIRCLMSIENPSDEIKNAIISACAWLDRDDIKIWGYELVRKPIEEQKIGARYYNFDQILVPKENAEPLWARFYDLKKMKPIWTDRGPKFCAEYNDIGIERRNGYRYVYNWPAKLLAEDYPAWKAKNNIQ